MKRFLLMVIITFSLCSLAGYAIADSIWIDTRSEALREAERSVAIQMLKADYSADRVYGGVDAVIHFSANCKDYTLYHALDNYSGCFVLSTVGIEPYPYTSFGGEDDNGAKEYFEAEDAAREAYLALKRSPETRARYAVGNGRYVVQTGFGDLGDKRIPLPLLYCLAALVIVSIVVIHKKKIRLR